ncbi:uncharacterized protein LOC126766534 [Bactrocera neohumeralis]|uniref:uncharacterized protein LOC126766534 n=1 Tax=Bactrocera neohumeralis TaxID=98809 RepID=UPI00216600DD|nr:uncharacterized protein LOC126766534 [Bactrocera neohumeralis]
MSLLDALEEDKKALGDQLEAVSGRTVLTKVALMVFAKADDEERSGHVSMSIVRLFFTAAILFEATEQFTSDNKMDSVAAEKCRYARYTAAKMKKALDRHQPYTSANPIEAPLNEPAEANKKGEDGKPTAPPPPPAAPPVAPPATVNDDVDRPPTYTQSNRPPPPPPAASTKSMQNNHSNILDLLHRQRGPSSNSNSSSRTASSSGYTPSPEDMIDAHTEVLSAGRQRSPVL